MNQAQDLIMLQSIGIDPSKVLWNGNKNTNAIIRPNGLYPFGRIIAFVFAGETPTEDGDADFFLEAEQIKTSLNYILAQAGLVYPSTLSLVELYLMPLLTPN